MSDSGDEERDDPSSTETHSEEEIIEALLANSSVSLKNLVPNGPVKSKNAVKVACWILSSNSKKRNPMVINQRVKWLTTVVQYGVVDSLRELQQLFTPLVQLVFISKYHASICHLLYMLATPHLYKFQVERITKHVNIVGLTKPLAGLLSRLKSLRPDLVPQAFPHHSSAVSFPKAPHAMRDGMYALSERIKENNELPNIVTHSVEVEQKRAAKKMRLDIIPRAQHINLKSSFEVDFRKMVLLTQFQTFDELVAKITTVEVPNHVGSLLSKREYHYVLALNFTPYMEALLSQWLYLTLCHEFLEKSQLTGVEGKVLILNRVIEFQQSTGRKLMAVYDFLSEFLETWDGVQYSEQVFQLLADIPFLPYTDLRENFLRALENQFHYAPTSHRLNIINTCRNMIHNMLRQKFKPAPKGESVFHKSNNLSSDEVAELVEGVYVINEVIRFAQRLLNIALTSSDNLTIVFESLLFYLWLIDVEDEYQLPFRTFCQPITVYQALFSPAPATISLLCQLLCKYKDLGSKQLISMSVLPELEEFLQDAQDNAGLLNRYVNDTSSCLFYQNAFGRSDNHSLLSRIPRKTLKHLDTLGLYKAAFDYARHPAFTGIARQWINTKSDDLSDPVAERVSDAIQQDLDGYVSFLFGCFPSIKAYARQFHQH